MCFLKVKDPNMKTRKGKPMMVGYQPTMPANAPTLTPVLYRTTKKYADAMFYACIIYFTNAMSRGFYCGRVGLDYQIYKGAFL